MASVSAWFRARSFWLTRHTADKTREIKSENTSLKIDDQPISRREEDKFGFRGYSDVLIKRLLQAKPPITIGIFGNWGSGKTSLMRLIDEDLREHNEGIVTVWINVWQLSNQEEVWHAFLQALFSKVHRKLKLWQRINKPKFLGQLAINMLRILIVITPLIVGTLISAPVAGEEGILGNMASRGSAYLTLALLLWMLSQLKPILDAAHETVNFDLKELLKHSSYEQQITTLEKLGKLFEQLVCNLVTENGRLVVFIDDLDRCTPDKTPEVLEAIKVFANTPRCVYVIGVDHDIVQGGIQQKYSFSERAATEYLEKIIQIPFHLPPIEPLRIQSYIEKDHEDVSHSICEAAPGIFSVGLEPNPRKIKRGLNIYRTLFDLAESRWRNWEMEQRINPELLAKMVIIQNRYRLLFLHLIGFPQHLADIQSFAVERESSKKRKIIADMKKNEDWQAFFKENGKYVDWDIIENLSRFIGLGKSRFLENNIETYIYLTGTAEGLTQSVVPPSRVERETLLSGDLEAIQHKVSEIKALGNKVTISEKIVLDYKERLENVLFDETGRYNTSERISADLALDFFEDWSRQRLEPKTVLVSEGEFIFGVPQSSNGLALNGKELSHTLYLEYAEKYPSLFSSETREIAGEEYNQKIFLPPFRIGRYPVTNAEYKIFIDDTKYARPKHWKGNDYPEGISDHPVVNVSWLDAVAYCQWLRKITGRNYKLPSELQWEKAARGTSGYIYPWGQDFKSGYSNLAELNIKNTTPVGKFLRGISPFGLFDCVGNIWEWTNSSAETIDYIYSDDISSKLQAGEKMLLKGGSCATSPKIVHCSTRIANPVEKSFRDTGFRIAICPLN